MKWRTRSQRIGTFAQIPFEVAILDTRAAPIYQQIAPKAVQLQQLGLSNSAIAKRLGVTDKTVAKCVVWLRRVQHRPDGWEDVAQRTVMRQLICVILLKDDSGGHNPPRTHLDAESNFP